MEDKGNDQFDEAVEERVINEVAVLSTLFLFISDDGFKAPRHSA
jgi:hypothetical protein